MAEATTNNAANVSVGKGKPGNYANSAPIGTTLPVSIDEESLTRHSRTSASSARTASRTASRRTPRTSST